MQNDHLITGKWAVKHIGIFISKRDPSGSILIYLLYLLGFRDKLDWKGLTSKYQIWNFLIFNNFNAGFPKMIISMGFWWTIKELFQKGAQSPKFRILGRFMELFTIQFLMQCFSLNWLGQDISFIYKIFLWFRRWTWLKRANNSRILKFENIFLPILMQIFAKLWSFELLMNH